jgi:putative transposase
MPSGLVRIQKAGCFHFITFSCYHRLPFLARPGAYSIFENELECVRQQYQFVIAAYVLMPEHVHLLVGEPRISSLATALQVLKQRSSKILKGPAEAQFWQTRYYDFNVHNEKKRIEKLRYMHRIPSSADSSKNPANGTGRVSITTRKEKSASSRSNPTGPHFDAETDCRKTCATNQRLHKTLVSQVRRHGPGAPGDLSHPRIR